MQENKEAVAKLPVPGKSMILGQFDGAASAPCPIFREHTQEGRAREQGGKMAQKGDFTAVGSFATGSNIYFGHSASKLNSKSSINQLLRIER